MTANEIIDEYVTATRKALAVLIENKNMFDEVSLSCLVDCTEDNIREFKSENWDERTDEEILQDERESNYCDKWHERHENN